MNKLMKDKKYHPLPSRNCNISCNKRKIDKKSINKYNNAAVAITKAINMTYYEPHTGTITEKKHSVERELNPMQNT